MVVEKGNIFSLDVSLFGNTSSERNKQDEYHMKLFTLVTFLSHIFTQLYFYKDLNQICVS